MKPFRRWVALGALMVLGGIVSAQEAPNISNPWDGTRRGTDFVRQPDTTCACLSDTTVGPTIYCFGARRIIWRIKANSGTCSTLVVQVSNNDTNWTSAPAFLVSAHSNFVVGDSLNTGGTLIAEFPVDSVRASASVAIPWRYSRVVARHRAGVASNNDCTILCRAKTDSLRFIPNVVWSAP